MAKDVQGLLKKKHDTGEITMYDGVTGNPLPREPVGPVIEGSPQNDSPDNVDPMESLRKLDDQDPETWEAELEEDMKKLKSAGFNVDVEDDSTENEEAIFSDLPPEYREEPKSDKITKDQVRQMKAQGIVIKACQDYAAKKGLDITNDEVHNAVFWRMVNKTDPNATLENQIKQATQLTLEKLGKTIPYDRPVTMDELISKDRSRQKYAGGPSAQSTAKKQESEQPKTLDDIMTKIEKGRKM